jgi:3'(2'), 5'-bisphosphate nucleotidase
VKKSKLYAGRNGERVVSPQRGLNYLDGRGGGELRENAQWNVEYGAVESVKQPTLMRGSLATTGTWVAPCISHARVAIILGRETGTAMLKKELEIAKELVAKAGNILLEHYQENPSVNWKGIDAPVTTADRAASELLVGELKRLFPGDGRLSKEEQDDLARLGRSRVWIIDPMDGTREFIDHLDEFAVMIGVAVDGMARLGVVCQPTAGKIYYATTGSGAFLEERGARRRLLVSTEADPSRMTAALSRSHHSSRVDLICDHLGIKETVRSGSSGLKVGLICEGRAHLYLHTGARTCQWDTRAAEAILREAGGQMTDAYGAPLRYNDPELRNLRGVIASNGVTHDRIVEITKSVASGFL